MRRWLTWLKSLNPTVKNKDDKEGEIEKTKNAKTKNAKIENQKIENQKIESQKNNPLKSRSLSRGFPIPTLTLNYKIVRGRNNKL